MLVRVSFIGLLLAMFVSLSAGCSIAEITRPDSYTVKRGDTLYSIAWRHEVDWREVARWNHISAPYRIYPGQKLSLERYPKIKQSTSTPTNSVSQSPPPPPVASAPPDVVSPPLRGATAPRQAPRVVRLPDDDAASPPLVMRTPPAQPSVKPPETVKAAKISRPSTPPAARPAVFDPDSWRWPVGGKLLRGYSNSQARQGIDIGGTAGQEVVASNAGRVVYSGSGLRGYGNLVIIKHDDEFLSAYGFNQSLLVAEGQNVAPGQPIAQMGFGPRNEAMLHFEIRRDGRPVDPQTILPRR